MQKEVNNLKAQLAKAKGIGNASDLLQFSNDNLRKKFTDAEESSRRAFVVVMRLSGDVTKLHYLSRMGSRAA